MKHEEIPDDIIEIYTFSNTPSYLYRKMMTSEYVDYLSSKDSNFFSKILIEQRENKFVKICLKYAILISILKTGQRVPVGVFDDLEWKDQIIAIHAQKSIPTSVSVIKMPLITTPIIA